MNRSMLIKTEEKLSYILNYRRLFDFLAVLFFILAGQKSKSIFDAGLMFSILSIFLGTFIYRWKNDLNFRKENYNIKTSFEMREICWILVCILGVVGSICQTAPISSVIPLLIVWKLLFVDNKDIFGWSDSWIIYLIVATAAGLFHYLGIDLELYRYSFLLAAITILGLMSGVHNINTHFEWDRLYGIKIVENALRTCLCVGAYYLLVFGVLNLATRIILF